MQVTADEHGIKLPLLPDSGRMTTADQTPNKPSNKKVIEYRKKALQDYLQNILNVPAFQNSDELRVFLGLASDDE